MARWFLVALALVATGCHRYVPAPLGAVPEGAEVRVHLSEEAADRIGARYGNRMEEVSGRLQRWSDEVVIAVPVPVAPGLVDRDLQNRVILPVADVLAIDVQERDRTRTILLGAAIGGVVLWAAISAISGVFGGTTGEDPPFEDQSVVPLWLRVFP